MKLLSLHIDELARRLLDLSNRNRLLNFRHAARSRTHIRVVDEVPEVLFQALRSGKSFRFRGFPVPPVAFDESGKQLPRPDIAEVARREGIDPAFDLPPPSPTPAARHRDAMLQTLHYRDEMERRLEGIRLDYEGLRQELGIPSLYACFGFLEWFEREDSDRAMLAPLALLPLDIARERQPDGLRYSVSATSDDAEENITLEKRLEQDFHIRLPAWPEDGDLAAYFAAVESAIANQPRWRVRRCVTVAVLHFSRQVMYEALQKARSAGALAQPHPVLERLLVGGGRDGDGHEPAPAEEEETGPEPFLIDVADGSQEAAIRAALAGRNLVIKGPPGTGKSQTITNLIAAALERGEKVLFVADKMAALEVVKSRLDRAGVGVFCLELHSTKAKKRAVLDALAAALQARTEAVEPAKLAKKIQRRAECRARLDQYLAAMAEVVGKLGLPLREILGNEQRLRPKAPPAAVAGMYLPHAAALSPTELTEDRQLLERLGEADTAVRAIEREGPSLWRHLARSEMSPVEQSALLAALQQWQRAVDGALAVSSRLPEEARPGEVAALEALAACEVPAAGGVDEALLAHVSEDSAAALGEVVAAVRKRDRHRAAAARAVAKPERAVGALGELAGLYETARVARIETVWPARLRQAAAGLEDEAARLEAAAAAAARFGDEHGIARGPERFAALAAGWHIARGVPAAVWAARNPALADPAARPALEAAAARAAQLVEARAGWKERLPGWQDEEAGWLRAQATILRATGFFGRLFGGAYRRAKAAYLALSVGRAAPRDEMADAMEGLARHIDEVSALAGDGALAALCGAAFRGIDTDFGLLTRAHDLRRAAADALGGSGAARAQVRRLLTDGPVDTCIALGRLFDEGQAAPIESFMRSELGDPAEAAAAWRADAARLRAGADLCERLGMQGQLRIEELGNAIRELGGMRQQQELLDRSEAAAALGSLRPQVLSDPSGLERALAFYAQVAALPIAEATRRWVLAADRLGRLRLLGEVARALGPALAEVRATGTAVQKGGLDLGAALAGAPNLEQWRALGETALARASEMDTFLSYSRWRAAALGHTRVAAVVEACGAGQLAEVARLYEWLVYRSLVTDASKRRPELASWAWSGAQLEALREEFRALDREVLELQGRALAARLAQTPVPAGIGSGPRGTWTELALLRNEMNKKMRLVPIRQLMRRAGNAVLALTPCLMMSPHSVAQYLDDSEVTFDLVVIDEASQMRPEEALLPISRARRIAVVGDDQQLPPTTFFDRLEADEVELRGEADEVIDEKVAAESILDLALAAYPNACELRWHYRSRHPSLIAFSNQEFYEGKLLLFPSPTGPEAPLGVTWRQVAGDYHAGINRPEAEAVAAEAMRLMRERPDCSIGVVALNKGQADLIRELCEERLAESDGSYEARWKDTIYPFFVKNLENVQGDERDIILISMTYGRAEGQDRVRQNFGPINGRYGHRRLNVLFTRARQQIVVFSSMTASDVQVQPTSARGVRVLRDYLAYAATGGAALPAAGKGLDAAQSPFEELVARELLREGYGLEAQVGVNGFFIDLGLRHPRWPHGFLCGIECDGATYHSIKSARDRDRIRQDILEALGWKLIRVWSTDWFRDPRTARARLIEKIERLAAERAGPASRRREPEKAHVAD